VSIRTVALVALLTIPITAFSLEIHGSTGAGYDTSTEVYFTNIEIEMLPLSVLVIFGGWETDFLFSVPDLAGYPVLDTYTVGIRLLLRSFWAEVEHGCSHPVWSNIAGYRFDGAAVWTRFSAGVRW